MLLSTWLISSNNHYAMEVYGTNDIPVSNQGGFQHLLHTTEGKKFSRLKSFLQIVLKLNDDHRLLGRGL